MRKCERHKMSAWHPSLPGHGTGAEAVQRQVNKAGVMRLDRFMSREKLAEMVSLPGFTGNWRGESWFVRKGPPLS
ncbi:unnamed protein product [Protopolystoma xenopodis]|uniref:Uncharacterized protein n=1 Tax=Protopolystoma xenopodis TaxID=117903 RepID=A0A448WZF9_9PLAT|nr:unnamed protein product [Protopolystoma xenopodis]